MLNLPVADWESERLGTGWEKFKAGCLNIFYLDCLTEFHNEPEEKERNTFSPRM